MTTENKLGKMDIDFICNVSEYENSEEISSRYYYPWNLHFKIISPYGNNNCQNLSPIRELEEKPSPNLNIKIIKYPNGKELVYRKKIKFSIMVTGDYTCHVHMFLFVAIILVDSKNLTPIRKGLIKIMEGNKNSNSLQDFILEKTTVYNEIEFVFKIKNGSAQRKIINQVKFELRLYKNIDGNGKYHVMDTAISHEYRIFTHTKQLGRDE